MVLVKHLVLIYYAYHEPDIENLTFRLPLRCDSYAQNGDNDNQNDFKNRDIMRSQRELEM